MQPLDRLLRRQLENTVKDARDTAEEAARGALEQLGVREASPFEHLTAGEKDLRRRLRIHGRQLGDERQASGVQSVDRLAEEVGYQHWHRMLFARYLAENNLLMYPDPDSPVPVTLAECDDLAADEGARNGWELAARFATGMLPQIFRVDSPVFELALPPEHEQKLERLVADLPQDVFHASDSLGWVYQFWQARRKDEVNASEVKIGARELPAVTQLFTEPYMVAFLLDNALGAWWAARRLTKEDLATAATEDELRRKASLPGVPLEYLRFVKGDDGAWTPAAGTFDGWPAALRDLKVLDPCCGSGHFLVAVLLMLVPMRMELEGLSTQHAVDAVLRDNLHGLEIDPRCVELAAFALALTAWRMSGGYRVLPLMNVACSGLSVGVAREEWQKLAEGNRNLKVALGWMYDAFRDAPVLGSLFNPAKAEAAKLELFGLTWDEVARHLDEALQREQSDEGREAGVVAHGLARAAMILAGKYDWVVTNVPYLKRGNQCEALQAFSKRHYPKSKAELATVFLERCLDMLVPRGATGMVLPQNWLFLTPTYKELRCSLLASDTWNVVAQLGPGAFDTVSGEVVKAILLCMTRGAPTSLDPASFLDTVFSIEVSHATPISRKADFLRNSPLLEVLQHDLLANPSNLDCRFIVGATQDVELLQQYADSCHGQGTFDDPCYCFSFWELHVIDEEWVEQQTTVPDTVHFGGCHGVLRWENGGGMLARTMDAKRRLEGYSSGKWRAGVQVWGRRGVLVNQMGQLNVSLYAGKAFDLNAAAVIPRRDRDLSAIWAYSAGDAYNLAVREIDKQLKVTNSTLVKVPFDLPHWQQVAAKQYPHGLPAPYSNDPTQWIFHGHPCGSVVFGETSRVVEHALVRTDTTVLQVAVARLLGYRWPAELDPAMELAGPQREWVGRCESLLPFVDEDGIVCIPAVRGEGAAADRLLDLLAAAYGSEWSGSILNELLKEAGCAGKTLEVWLRDLFFAQHCEMFHQRPFIWQVWDGLRDGFSALVNYHKLDRKNLETLIYTYLGDWINRQKQDVANGVDSAKEKLSAAVSLQKKLELIRDGESPYDIFVRWKPLHQQPVGWEPDLNDGVRLNIRPFVSVPDVKVKDAGVLRIKPKVTWQKDRGKDVETAPWYTLGPDPRYGGNLGDRINDHHLTLADKTAARSAQKVQDVP